MKAMQQKYPDDRFEIIPKKVDSQPQWRVRCVDCPGDFALFSWVNAAIHPGPQETLTNFEVHLRNRQHRHRVNSRIGGVVMVTLSSSSFLSHLLSIALLQQSRPWLPVSVASWIVICPRGFSFFSFFIITLQHGFKEITCTRSAANSPSRFP
jgi:hypothetical protein